VLTENVFIQNGLFQLGSILIFLPRGDPIGRNVEKVFIKKNRLKQSKKQNQQNTFCAFVGTVFQISFDLSDFLGVTGQFFLV
jgi:hypothetical protein